MESNADFAYFYKSMVDPVCVKCKEHRAGALVVVALMAVSKTWMRVVVCSNCLAKALCYTTANESANAEKEAFAQ